MTIAGSDCSGGAGIQESTPEFLKQQTDAIFEDIYPDAVKIGMVSSSELICVIAESGRKSTLPMDVLFS